MTLQDKNKIQTAKAEKLHLSIILPEFMMAREKLERFLLGRNPFPGSHTEFKSAILCGQLALAMFAIGILYIVIDVSNGVRSLIVFYSIMLILSCVIIGLLRYQKYRIAKMIFIPCASFLAFIFASNDTYQAGVYIYFIIVGLVSFALFGYNDRLLAFATLALLLLLFYLSYVKGIRIELVSEEEWARIYDEDYIRLSFISNFIIGIIVAVLIIYFLLDVNQHSEKKILTQNLQLAKTNRELDRFVYSASHDLKSPLSSLKGLIDLASRSMTDEERQICFDHMKVSIRNMEDFIAEIIDYSRNARTEVKQERIILAAVCHQIIGELKFLEGAGSVQVHLQMDETLSVVTDPARLRVILSNVLGNAMKYRDPNKENQWVIVQAQMVSDKAIIEIKDNGLGIGPEHLGRIFEMFYRASENSQGSGLGLYIVQETLDRLKGKIRVQSVLGEGTTFQIELPQNI